MRLISCHIEGFGKLSGVDMDFDGGLNVICQENGWGKSTFAAFIRAMLYGLDGSGKRDIEANERKRFKPWQGGVFGGSLVIEVNGRNYRITRTFGAKDKDDEFELRDADTNLLSKDYSSSIGEEIFKLDRNSFMNTVYIDQNRCRASATDNINAKISNLTDDAGDLNNYESASKLFKDLLNSMNPSRVTGSIKKRENEIADLETKIRDGQGLASSVDRCQALLDEEADKEKKLKVELAESLKLQEKVSKQHAGLVRKKQWEDFKAALSDRKKVIEVLKEKVPDIPGTDEAKSIIDICSEMEKANERRKTYHMNDDESGELEHFKEIFADSVPGDEDIDENISKASRISRIIQEISSVSYSPVDERRLEELSEHFANEDVSVSEIVSAWEVRNRKKDAILSKQASLTALKAANPKQPQRGLSPLVIAGAVIALCGIALAVILGSLPAAGIAVSVAGLIILCVGLFAGSKPKPAEESPDVRNDIENLNRSIQEDFDYISRVDKQTTEYLRKHGEPFDEERVSVALSDIEKEANEYFSLVRKKSQAQNSELKQECDRLEREVKSYLGSYGVKSGAEGFKDDLYDLKESATDYIRLKDKKERYDEADKEYRKHLAAIAEFLKRCDVKPEKNLPEQLRSIGAIASDYENAVKEYQTANDKLKEFEAENDTDELSKINEEEQLPSIESISEKIEQLNDEIGHIQEIKTGYNKKIQELTQQLDDLEEIKYNLEELKKQQEEERRKFDLVTKASEKLTAAKEALTARYADPIKRGFDKYYKTISGKDADRFHIDANTRVTVDEYGMQRDEVTLSTGSRDMVGVCLRMALIDAMYEEEKPMIIMDDPFVNLDDDKLDGAKKLLEQAADTYQIVYFTCSSTRNV